MSILFYTFQDIIILIIYHENNKLEKILENSLNLNYKTLYFIHLRIFQRFYLNLIK